MIRSARSIRSARAGSPGRHAGRTRRPRSGARRRPAWRLGPAAIAVTATPRRASRAARVERVAAVVAAAGQHHHPGAVHVARVPGQQGCAHRREPGGGPAPSAPRPGRSPSARVPPSARRRPGMRLAWEFLLSRREASRTSSASWPMTRSARLASLAWIISRIVGSVPLGRTRTRPLPPSSASARATAAATSGPSCDASPGTLTSTCGYFGIILAAAAIGTPRRFTAASSCRLVSTPSPVVACSSMMMCPDCSPPST